MSTIARCTCGQDMQVLDQDLGVPIECPGCRRQVMVQRGSSAAIPVPPPAPVQGRPPYVLDSIGRFRPHNGGLILAFGLLSFVPCIGVVFAVAAWVMANGDLRQMEQGAMDPSGRSLVRAGKILGIVSLLVLPPLHFLFCLGWLV